MYQNDGIPNSNPVVSPGLTTPLAVPQEEKSNSRKWLVLGLIGAVVVVIVVAVLAIVLGGNSKARLLIKVTPASATIEVDGKQYVNGIYSIDSGKTMTAVITKDGFKRQVFEINAEANKNVVLATYLVGENGDLSYYKKDANYYDLYLLWEYFCEYTDAGQYWYVSEISKLQPQINENDLDEDEQKLYEFLMTS